MGGRDQHPRGPRGRGPIIHGLPVTPSPSTPTAAGTHQSPLLQHTHCSRDPPVTPSPARPLQPGRRARTRWGGGFVRPRTWGAKGAFARLDRILHGSLTAASGGMRAAGGPGATGSRPGPAQSRPSPARTRFPGLARGGFCVCPQGAPHPPSQHTGRRRRHRPRPCFLLPVGPHPTCLKAPPGSLPQQWETLRQGQRLPPGQHSDGC